MNCQEPNCREEALYSQKHAGGVWYLCGYHADENATELEDSDD